MAPILLRGVRQLCQRAALLAAIVEDFETRWLAGEAVDLSSHLSAVGVQRRVLSLGLHRQPRDVTPGLGDYLADSPHRAAGTSRRRGRAMTVAVIRLPHTL
jgi:hypothetical protein